MILELITKEEAVWIASLGSFLLILIIFTILSYIKEKSKKAYNYVITSIYLLSGLVALLGVGFDVIPNKYGYIGLILFGILTELFLFKVLDIIFKRKK